jgi:hypothetical protein
MNTNTAEPTTLTADQAEYAQQKENEATKYRKAQRYFPTASQIEGGDRFSISKGTSVYCATLSSTIVLHDDIKVEIVAKNNTDPFDVNATYDAVKLVRMGNGEWKPDSKFGTLDVGYLNLSAWHYVSK